MNSGVKVKSNKNIATILLLIITICLGIACSAIVSNSIERYKNSINTYLIPVGGNAEAIGNTFNGETALSGYTFVQISLQIDNKGNQAVDGKYISPVFSSSSGKMLSSQYAKTSEDDYQLYRSYREVIPAGRTVTIDYVVEVPLEETEVSVCIFDSYRSLDPSVAIDL